MLLVLREMLVQVAFTILGFGSDIGLGYVNCEVAEFFDEQHIDFTRSGAERCNDNALAEAKSGAAQCLESLPSDDRGGEHTGFDRCLRGLVARHASQAVAHIGYNRGSHVPLNVWPALKLCCSDDRIEMDNSATERALRGVAIERWNYLFVGADSSGEHAAAIY
jgi:hypothetical protein